MGERPPPEGTTTSSHRAVRFSAFGRPAGVLGAETVPSPVAGTGEVLLVG